MDDETLVWSGRPSWRSMLSFYVRWVVPALLPAIVITLVDALTDADWPVEIGVAISVVLLIVVLVWGWLSRLDTRFTVTTHRLIIRHGILARREQSAHIDRVQNITTRQTVVDRMLGVGAVDFDTAGTDDYEFVFGGVRHPQGLRERIARSYTSRAADLDADRR